ncbi:MAG TPA: peptidoglycan DD-metalloendopeptidase family protein [Clostridia bacterium]|nr:peptidoglycan DD-metalloendopeptidase family protein [Clostridia bacterium]
MKKRQKSFLTIIVIPHSAARYNSIRLSTSLVHSCVYACVTALILLAYFFASYSDLRDDTKDLERLRRLTVEQQRQIRTLADRASRLESEMQGLRSLNDEVRDLLDSQRWEVAGKKIIPEELAHGASATTPGGPAGGGDPGPTGQAAVVANQEKAEEPDLFAPGVDSGASPSGRKANNITARGGYLPGRIPERLLLASKAHLGDLALGQASTLRSSLAGDHSTLQLDLDEIDSILDRVEASLSDTEKDLQNLIRALEKRRSLQRALPTIWPLRGRVTSRYGWRRSPFGRWNEFHSGIDIAAPSGTIIRAAADGKVVFAGRKGSLGLTVILRHDHGYSTYYGHCSKILVKVGERVTQSQPIARVGTSGRSTGPHLHYEIHFNGSRIDPKTMIEE